MSGGSTPQDNSVQLEQMREDSASKAQAAQDQKDQQRKADLAALRGQSISNAGNTANSYFASRGLVPGDYSADIQREVNQLAGGIAPDDPNPGSYFNNVGELAYNDAKTARVNQFMRDLDRIMPANFEQSRIGDNITDPTETAIDAEQRSNADAIVRNMLNRGVITNTGFSAAEKNLDTQDYGVKARLNQIGQGVVAQGRQGLSDIGNKARSAASNYDLGQQFDPYSYGTQLDANFSDFMKNLDTNMRGQVTGNLFDTSGLAAVAGSAQGGQNTAFNPDALAGIVTTDDEEKKKKDQSRQAASTGVF